MNASVKYLVSSLARRGTGRSWLFSNVPPPLCKGEDFDDLLPFTEGLLERRDTRELQPFVLPNTHALTNRASS